MANKIRDTQKFFSAPIIPNAPPEYNPALEASKNTILRFYFQGVDEALRQALQFDSDDIIDGSIPNSKLENSTVSFGGVTLSLGGSDATPAFNLSDATGYPTSSLVGTITNAQLAGSITNAKLVNDSVSYGGVSLDLGQSDATPAFDLSDATNYPTSSLVGTITNAQLAGSITNAKLVNDSVSYGGVSLDLGQSDATPAFDLSDATNYPTSSLSGTIATAQIADLAVTGAKIADATITYHKMGTSSVSSTAIQPSAVTTNKIADDAVTNAKLADNSVGTSQLGDFTITTDKLTTNAVATAKIADDAVTSAKITGPFSSKHSFSNNYSYIINTSAAVTFFTFSIPAPSGGVEATQSLCASVRVRFYNTSSSAKENHQWKIHTQMKSKTVGGTSLGTATFVSSPSAYNAFYTVSGDKTSILCSNRGNFGTTATGANSGTFVATYYDDTSDKTFFRVNKFPDASTVYNGVEVFYSPTAFVTPGTYVSQQGFNNQYLTIGAPTAYQTIEVPLMATFGRSTTATGIRLQFDHVTTPTNLNTVVTGLYGYVENTV